MVEIKQEEQVVELEGKGEEKAGRGNNKRAGEKGGEGQQIWSCLCVDLPFVWNENSECL